MSAARALRAGLVAYLVVLLIMALFEENFIFLPSRYPEGHWEPEGLALEDAHFTADDGTSLHGWYLHHENPLAVVLFAHGNAGNVTHRAPIIHHLHSLGASIMVFDYRGFGKSEGKPNEEGVIADARAARAWLANRNGLNTQEIVLLGRSLGGAVMVDLAVADGAAGLILESTFTSMPDVAASVYPWLPVRMLMRTQFNSHEKIKRYQGPLLHSHGAADEIVPYELGRRLFDAAGTDDKEFIALNDHGHNDLGPESYYTRLRQFLQRVGNGNRP